MITYKIELTYLDGGTDEIVRYRWRTPCTIS